MDIHYDPLKASVNLKKHGIDFEDARMVLFDPLALVKEDTSVIGEQRFVTVGTDTLGRLLTVVYSYRNEHIRLISARKATTKERKDYAQGI